MTLPFLYANPNPHAPVRANGVRFHGYPSRNRKVRLIVVHTAESTPDYIGEDGGAEAVARFQAGTDRPSSYHEIVDSDSVMVMLPPEATAFGAKGANADGWHLSFATRAHLWPGKPQAWRDGALELAAGRARRIADLYDIPVRRLSRSECLAGASGFVAHGDVDPLRRSDPGGAFPWRDFLNLVSGNQSVGEDEMRRGDSGGDVAKLQQRLNNCGADLTTDGDYGPLTETAVRKFQEAEGLDVTGVASLMTVVHVQAIAHGRGSHT